MKKRFYMWEFTVDEFLGKQVVCVKLNAMANRMIEVDSENYKRHIKEVLWEIDFYKDFGTTIVKGKDLLPPYEGIDQQIIESEEE